MFADSKISITFAFEIKTHNTMKAYSNKFEKEVKDLIDRAAECVPNYYNYSHDYKDFAMKRLVGYALNNNLGIKAEEFPFEDYVGEIGIKYCDARPNSDTLNDLIYKLTW